MSEIRIEAVADIYIEDGTVRIDCFATQPSGFLGPSGSLTIPAEAAERVLMSVLARSNAIKTALEERQRAARDERRRRAPAAGCGQRAG